MVTKNEVRSVLLQRRNSMTPSQRENADSEICRKVISYMENKPKDICLLYYPLGVEVDIRPVIDWALAQRKIVGLPKVTGDDMAFYRITDVERDLAKGTFGIMEPITNALIIPDGQNSLCAVPGVGFDLMGHRLGRGKGYYDRFLTKYLPEKIGIAYHCQLWDKLPVEPHDVVMDQVITEWGEKDES
jgi:5-formyltetrahydrofolate cyclo-ligase